MKLTFSRQELMAALLFASTDESRYVLNGLCLNYRPGQQPLCIATDGRRLCVIESKAEQEAQPEADKEDQIVVCSDFIKPVCALNKAFGGKLFPWITLTSTAGSVRLSASMIGGKIWLEAEEKALIDMPYSNWKQIIPPKTQDREPMEALGVNAEFIGDFAKAAKLLEADAPVISLNLVGPDRCVEVAMPQRPQFYGLFMPCRQEEKIDFQPEFISVTKQFKAPEDKPKVEAAA